MAFNNYYGNNQKRGTNKANAKRSRNQSKYTKQQRKCYEQGKAYRLGEQGKAIDFKNPENRNSFMAGYLDINPARYPDKPNKGDKK